MTFTPEGKNKSHYTSCHRFIPIFFRSHSLYCEPPRRFVDSTLLKRSSLVESFIRNWKKWKKNFREFHTTRSQTKAVDRVTELTFLWKKSVCRFPSANRTGEARRKSQRKKRNKREAEDTDIARWASTGIHRACMRSLRNKSRGGFFCVLFPK